jgi:carbonic anhydrase/acetyltransferase-like protein (isoleucine patch superfamily)
MIQKNPKTSWMDSKTPKIEPSAYIHPSAVVIGDVKIGANVFVGPHVSIRGDEGGPIVIGSGSNVQDHVVMHALKGERIVIGQEVCVAHAAIVHGGCTIGDHSFIGFGATVFKANIGKGCFLSTRALFCRTTGSSQTRKLWTLLRRLLRLVTSLNHSAS